MRYIWWCVGLLCGFMACSPKANQRSSAPPPTAPQPPTVEIDVVTDSLITPLPTPELIIHFERQPCHGKCSDYEVRVYSDGRAVYHGRNHVERLGYYECRLAAYEIETLYLIAEREDFWQLEDQYPLRGKALQFLPVTTTYFKLNGQSKKIVDRYEAPLRLQRLEKALEDYFARLLWRKS